jgi:hypothetical protein
MKGKILIIFFVALFCLSSIPYVTETVSAVSYTYLEDFEGGVATQQLTYLQSHSGRIKSFAFSPVHYSYITTGSKRSGTYGYNALLENSATLPYCLFNFTTGTDVMTGFSMYVQCAPTSNINNFMFYNRSTGHLLIHMRTTSASWFRFLNELGSEVTIGALETGYLLLRWETNGTTGIVDYFWGNRSYYGGIARNPTYISSGETVDQLKVTETYTSLEYNIYMDDMNFTLSDSYNVGSGGGACGYDLNDYSKIGIDNTPNTLTVSGYQMMKINHVLSTGTLKGVSLCVAPEQYADDSDVNNYTVKILGFPEQPADCFYKDGFNYRLFWSCDIYLGEPIPNQENGEFLFAQFFHRKLLSGFYNTYWLPCIGGTATTDLDNDGEIFFKYGNTDEVPQTRVNYDLGVSFYLTKESTIPKTNLTDSLGLHNWISKNTTGYLYELGQPEGIVCSYILGDSTYTYRIEVYHNGSIFKTYNNLNFPAGINGFIPILNGRYDFRLYNYKYVYNVTAYVTGSLPSDFFLATEPLFTKPYEAYNIYYKFYHMQGYDGQIGIFDDNSLSSDFTKAHTTFGFPNNQSNTIPYDSTSLTNEYLTLFVDHAPFNAVYHTTHYISNPTVEGTWDLSLSKDVLKIKRGNPDNLNISINGYHPFLATDTGIYVDGIKKYDVRENQVFSLSFTPHDTFSHRYNISLETRQDNGMNILKTVFLTVTIEDDGTVEPPVMSLLPPPFSYIAGAIITLMFVIAPVIFIGKVGIDNSIMKYVPVFTGMVGFILSCLVGFFPWYAIFGLVLILVLVITVMWQNNKA